MRKQIPLVANMDGVIGYPAFNAALGDLVSFIKNGYVVENSSSLDNAYKYTIVQRPNVYGTPLENFSISAQKVAACRDVGSTSIFKIYSNGTLAGTYCYLDNTNKALPGTWSSATKRYHLIQLTGSNSVSLYGGYCWFMGTSTEGAVVASDGTITEVTDADYTAWGNKTPPVAMDGFVFQANGLTCKIYHSDQNAPTSWAATSVIDANLVPGKIVSLQRVRNYLLAFKSNSIEFFKNAGNPTPGSTLDAVPELHLRYGLLYEKCITRVQDAIVWIGVDETGNTGVFMMNTSNFEVKRISNITVDKYVYANYGNGVPTVEANLDGIVEVSTLPWRGKEFVIFPVDAGSLATMSFVYDRAVDLWYVWTVLYDGGETAFPYSIIKSDTTNLVYVYSPHFDNVAGAHNQSRSLDDTQNEGDFRIKADNSQQTSQNITMKWASNPMDFGSFKRKFQSSLELSYDLFQGTSSSGTISMYYYDDDGTTPCTTRSVTTTTNGAARAIWRRLGSFRKRQYVISHTGKEKIRFNVVEADLSSSDEATD